LSGLYSLGGTHVSLVGDEMVFVCLVSLVSLVRGKMLSVVGVL